MSGAESPIRGVISQSVVDRSGFKEISLPSLTPVESVARSLTKTPGEFSRIQQVFVLKAHGLDYGQIANLLKTDYRRVNNYVYRATSGILSTTDVILLLAVSDKKILKLMTKGLDFSLRGRLDDNEKKILDMICQDNGHISNPDSAHRLGISKETLGRRFTKIFPVIGVRNKEQAIIYNIFAKGIIPKVENGNQSQLPPRKEEIWELLVGSESLDIKEIAQRLNLAGRTVEDYVIAIKQRLGISDHRDFRIPDSEVDIRPPGIRVLEKRALGLSYCEAANSLGISEASAKYHASLVKEKRTEMGTMAALLKQGRISVDTLKNAYDMARLLEIYENFDDYYREVVDYLRDSNNWGKTDQEMAPYFHLTVNGFKQRLKVVNHSLGFADKIQLEVFAHLLSLEGVPVVPALHTRRALAGSFIPLG